MRCIVVAGAIVVETGLGIVFPTGVHEGGGCQRAGDDFAEAVVLEPLGDGARGAGECGDGAEAIGVEEAVGEAAAHGKRFINRLAVGVGSRNRAR